jgi:hypothetical protein
VDAFARFCRDHHAVPIAVGLGVERVAYETATDAALVGHAEADCRAWDDVTLPSHVRLDVQERLTAIRVELWRRLHLPHRLDPVTGDVLTVIGDEAADPQGVRPIRRAWYAAATRVGF